MNDEIDEGEYLVGFINNTETGNVHIRCEIATFLSDKSSLASFYFTLSFYSCIGLPVNIRLVDLAKMMGIAFSTFSIHRKALEKFGLITVKRFGKNKVIIFNPVKSFSHFKVPQKGYEKYLEKKRKEVIFVSPEYVKTQEESQEQSRIEGLINQGVQKIEKQKREAKKREIQRFPNENYEMVLNAFKKYKKVGLLGPEIVRAKRAIKQMFLAQRTPKQIIDCIKFFSKQQKEEDFTWLRSWTLETVMKKMPEFLGGQLKSNKIGDDIPRI